MLASDTGEGYREGYDSLQLLSQPKGAILCFDGIKELAALRSSYSKTAYSHAFIGSGRGNRNVVPLVRSLSLMRDKRYGG